MTDHPADLAAVPPNDGSGTVLLAQFLATLHSRHKITFVLADSGSLGGNYGLTDLKDAVIWLDEANTLGEMRATIMHELTHLAHPNSPEEEVEAMTAELLVPLADALEAHARDEIEETAARLIVDSRLVRARLRAASPPPPAEAEAEAS